MLILVGVSVTVALNGGLFSSAQDATAKTETEKQNEEQLASGRVKIGNTWYDSLQHYAKGEISEDQSDSAGGTVATGRWEQDGNILKYVDANGQETDITVNIGDKVNYDEGTGHTTTPDIAKGAGSGTVINEETGKEQLTTREYTNEDLEWRVLGINKNGQVELISTNPMSRDNMLYLYGKNGYIYAEDNLNAFCDDLYGHGVDEEENRLAEKARSLNVDDINRVLGYNPEIENEGTIEFEIEYGIEYTYKYYDGEIYMIKTADITEETSDDMNYWICTNASEIYTLDGVLNEDSSSSIKIKKTNYQYTISDYITENIPTYGEFGDNIAELIAYGEDRQKAPQWLASKSISMDSMGGIGYQVFMINWGQSVEPYDQLYQADNTEMWSYECVRPVITLKSNVQFTDVDEDGVYEVNLAV